VAGAAADLAYGGDGSDYIDSGTGDDRAFGGVGDDWIVSGAGNDLIDSGDGNDIAGGDVGDDTCWGGAGIDAIWGGLGGDTLRGGADTDFLYGGGPDLAEDRFVFVAADAGWDVIGDFEDGMDRLDFASFGFADFQAFVTAGGFIGSVQIDGSQIVGIGDSLATIFVVPGGLIESSDLIFQ